MDPARDVIWFAHSHIKDFRILHQVPAIALHWAPSGQQKRNALTGGLDFTLCNCIRKEIHPRACWEAVEHWGRRGGKKQFSSCCPGNVLFCSGNFTLCFTSRFGSAEWAVTLCFQSKSAPIWKPKLKENTLSHYQSSQPCLDWKAEHTRAVRDADVHTGKEWDGNRQWISHQTGNLPASISHAKQMPMSVSCSVHTGAPGEGDRMTGAAAPSVARNHCKEGPHRYTSTCEPKRQRVFLSSVLN